MAERSSVTTEQFAKAALDALSTTDTILAGSGRTPAKASPSEMYAYAVDPNFQASPQLRNAINTDPRTRADFHHLLNNTARYHLPQVAAASSGDIESREAGGCKISFRPSRANADQMYVIIESIGDNFFSPGVLFVCGDEGQTDRLELPAAQNGRIQLLLERESDMAKGLLNIKTEVYLK